MVKEALCWAARLINEPMEERKKAIKIILRGVECFIKGKTSEKGQEFVANLKKNCTLIGFSPNIMYMAANEGKQDLHAFYVHPFAQRTLLYKVKGLPALLLTNGSIELDDSALRRIKGNETIEELFDILGITG